MLPFRHCLRYFWWKRLQIRVSVTVREWLIPTNIPSKISCCLRCRRLQVRVSVTVQVWFMPINKSLFASDEGVYKLGLVLPFRYGLCYFWSSYLQIRVSVLFGNGLYLPIYLQKTDVVSDEGVYKLGSVLMFRYGFCLSKSCLENPRKLLCYFWWKHLQIRVSVTVQVWFMPINKSLLISDEGVYKLGLMLPFRYGLCYFWWRRLQIRISVTVREWLLPANIPSKISCCLRWRRLQIRVSVTVQVWLMPVNIIPWNPSKTPI